MNSNLIVEFAEQRRRDLIADATTYRQARALRRLRKARRTRSGAAASPRVHPITAVRAWVATGQL